MIQIKMFPAESGDSFLIEHDSQPPTLILIDGGFSTTLRHFLLPALKSLAARERILNLVVSTHIDADHISGLIAFFAENGDADTPNIIEVRDVWHNSLRALTNQENTHASLGKEDDSLLREINRTGFPLSNGQSSPTFPIGARQGSSLASLIFKGGYCWNSGDGTQCVNSTVNPVREITPTTSVTVLAPSPLRLQELCKAWLTELRRLGFAGTIDQLGRCDDAFEFVCARQVSVSPESPEAISYSSRTTQSLRDLYKPDNSVTNGSSIALIVEIDHKRILLLSDSFAEDIEAAVRSLRPDTFPVLFDAIKLSHHGSYRNTSPALLELVDSPLFLISSNGETATRPSIEVLRAIVDRPAPFCRHLHFNYSTTASKELSGYLSASGTPFLVHDADTSWIGVG